MPAGGSAAVAAKPSAPSSSSRRRTSRSATRTVRARSCRKSRKEGSARAEGRGAEAHRRSDCHPREGGVPAELQRHAHRPRPRIRRGGVLRLADAARRLRRAGPPAGGALAPRRLPDRSHRCGTHRHGRPCSRAGGPLRHRSARASPCSGCAAPTRTWTRGARVVWAREVSDDFHARYSARFAHLPLPPAQDGPVAPAILRDRVGWYHRRARRRGHGRGRQGARGRARLQRLPRCRNARRNPRCAT